jgi:hypothetical protein
MCFYIIAILIYLTKGNKTVPAKVDTTCTEDEHKQTTKAGTAL